VARWYAEIIMNLEGVFATNAQTCPLPGEAHPFPLSENHLMMLEKDLKKDDDMPQVKVKYLMIFSQVAGKMEENVTVQEGGTIEDLLKMLYSRYGRKFKKLIEHDFENRSVIFVVNGQSKEATTPLMDGDEVLISYPVGGG
jgi:MoaD family protein